MIIVDASQGETPNQVRTKANQIHAICKKAQSHIAQIDTALKTIQIALKQVFDAGEASFLADHQKITNLSMLPYSNDNSLLMERLNSLSQAHKRAPSAYKASAVKLPDASGHIAIKYKAAHSILSHVIRAQFNALAFLTFKIAAESAHADYLKDRSVVLQKKADVTQQLNAILRELPSTLNRMLRARFENAMSKVDMLFQTDFVTLFTRELKFREDWDVVKDNLDSGHPMNLSDVPDIYRQEQLLLARIRNIYSVSINDLGQMEVHKASHESQRTYRHLKNWNPPSRGRGKHA